MLKYFFIVSFLIRMEQIWIPISIGVALVGIYWITNRLALYHLIETYISHRADPGTRLSYTEFLESIEHVKKISEPRRV